MNSIILKTIFFILLQFLVTLEYCSSKNFWNYKTTFIAELEKPLQPGDIITITGFNAEEAGTVQAGLSIANEYCDWINNKIDGCIEYDLTMNIDESKIYRRVYADSIMKHFVDEYHPLFMKKGRFTYTIKLTPDHFEATLNGYVLGPMKFLEPIESLILIKAYGSAIIQSYNVEYGKSTYF